VKDTRFVISLTDLQLNIVIIHVTVACILLEI